MSTALPTPLLFFIPNPTENKENPPGLRNQALCVIFPVEIKNMENTNQPKTSPQTQPIVTLTDAAVAKVLSMMAKEGKDGYCLRVGVVTGGCAGLSYEMKFQDRKSVV